MNHMVTDKLGRTLEIKDLNAMDQLDLLEAAQNHANYSKWFGLATLIFSCSMIDGVPLPAPRNPGDFRKNAMILKDEGIDAITDYFLNRSEPQEAGSFEDTVKN